MWLIAIVLIALPAVVIAIGSDMLAGGVRSLLAPAMAALFALGLLVVNVGLPIAVPLVLLWFLWHVWLRKVRRARRMEQARMDREQREIREEEQARK